MVPLYCVKRYSRKKIGFWDFNALNSGLKVPASATPNEVDRESVQKRVWVSEWVVTSSQEWRNPSSLDNCCFSSGEGFSSTRNKQIEVDKAMRSSSKQNKSIKLWDPQRSNDWAFAWTRAWFKHFRSISLFIPQNSTVNLRHSSHLGTKFNHSAPTTFFSRVLLLRQQPNLPPERPTTTIAIKTQVFMFRYELVNSTRKFTIVAEIVSLLKKIYKRDAPFRAVFKVKTLAVLFSAYPREMKHILRNLNLPPFWHCLFLWKWCNPFPRARARRKHAHSFDRCGALRYSWSDVIRHQSIITRSTSLGVAKAGNLKLNFVAKSIGIHLFGFEDIFRCSRDNENLKIHFGRMDTLKLQTVSKVTA